MEIKQPQGGGIKMDFEKRFTRDLKIICGVCTVLISAIMYGIVALIPLTMYVYQTLAPHLYIIERIMFLKN